MQCLVLKDSVNATTELENIKYFFVLVVIVITQYDFSMSCSLTKLALCSEGWLMEDRRSVWLQWSFLALFFFNIVMHLLISVSHTYVSM